MSIIVMGYQAVLLPNDDAVSGCQVGGLGNTRSEC